MLPDGRPRLGRPLGSGFRTVLSHVRFGSLADIGQPIRDVRFTPDSGHSSVQLECPKSVNSRHPVWSHKKLSGTANFGVRDLTLDPRSKVSKEASYVDLLVLAQLEVVQREGGA